MLYLAVCVSPLIATQFVSLDFFLDWFHQSYCLPRLFEDFLPLLPVTRLLFSFVWLCLRLACPMNGYNSYSFSNSYPCWCCQGIATNSSLPNAPVFFLLISQFVWRLVRIRESKGKHPHPAETRRATHCWLLLSSTTNGITSYSVKGLHQFTVGRPVPYVFCYVLLCLQYVPLPCVSAAFGRTDLLP